MAKPRLLALIILTFVGMLMAPLGGAAQAADQVRTHAPAQVRFVDKDCGDFPNQRAAQIFFLNNSPAADPHRLDADGDGVVCESLPCPCYYGSNPNPDGPSTPPTSPPKPPEPAPLKVVKVAEGDLLKLRQGSKPAFLVRLLGAKVPSSGDSCFTNGARRDLRKWVKPGRVVKIVEDSRAPKRDKQGHRRANVVTVKGNFTIGGSQVLRGWALVDRITFSDKPQYQRFAKQAESNGTGYYDKCAPES